MSHTHKCKSSKLVTKDALHISYCSCGMVHLHLGPISVRVSEQAFSDLADGASTAMIRLQNIKGAVSHPGPGVFGGGDFVSG